AHNNTARRSVGRRRRNGMRKTVHYVDGHVFIVQGQAMIEELPPAQDFKNPKAFVELEAADCRWPGAGEPGPQLQFCAAPAFKGYPYCLAHYRIAYSKPGSRIRQ